MICVSGLKKVYRSGGQDIAPLDGINFSCDRGEFILLTGRSGSGKTTFLNILAGLTRPTEGTVMIDGKDLFSLPDPELTSLRSLTFGIVFQFPGVLAPLTVIENVLLPVSLSGRKGDRTSYAQSLLSRIGLSGKASSLPTHLSGGELTRAAIARALINEPGLILADEPTSNLDAATELAVMELLSEIHSSGSTVIMATHNTDLSRYATRMMKIEQGKLVELPH